MITLIRNSLLPLILGLALGIFLSSLPSDPSSIAQPRTPTFEGSLPASQAELSSPHPLAQASTDETTVDSVAEIGFTVSDMDQVLPFYTEVLPFEVISDVEVMGTAYERLQGVFGARMRVVQLQLGEEVIELTDYLAPEGLPHPIDSRSNDLWFQHVAIVVSDMDAAYQVLRDNRVQHISTGPQTLPDTIPAAAGISAFYFRDPDGHTLELIHFPEDKGDPRWQQQTEDLFLGIDHTAIGISNTDQSLAFYQDQLGLELRGESENFGTEQEHLNAVFGARLRISGLKAEQGPGIEFLDYLAPDGGRPLPPQTQANDLIHWQTTLVVEDLDTLAADLLAEDVEFISPGVIEVDGDLGFARGILVRDLDGHAMRIVER